MNIGPLFITAAIIAAVSLLGLIISRWRKAHAFRDYEEYASAAQLVAEKLKAEVFRDRSDLVLNGNYVRRPTVVRFSHSDGTPGLNMRMRAAATFTMAVVPKGAKVTQGRVILRTADDVFDAGFVVRSDHPTQAKMLVGDKVALTHIQKLCCSAQTFLTITSEGVELSELTIPAPYTAQHIQGHLDSMGVLAKTLQQMPGADAIRITPFKKERSRIIQAALAAGILTALLVVAAAMFESRTTVPDATSATQETLVEGLTPAEAQRLGLASGFRVARATDFHPAGQGWVRSQTGHEVQAHLEAAFSGDFARDAAYVLVRQSGVDAGNKRVIVVARNQIAYEAAYPQLALVAKVPKSNFATAQWLGNPSAPDGDGLLLVRNTDDLNSGTVIYLSDGRIATAVPTTYQSVVIQ